MRRTPTLLCLLALGSALLVPQLLANDDVPHEKKGFQESGYALSQYENINLANGNLTYQVPLYTLRTDGGLEYPLTAYFNMKTWYTHRYCTLTTAGYEFCGEGGGEIQSAEVADGVEAYGFGWDLRPPRVQLARFGTHQRWPAVADASGARHLLKADPPWGTDELPFVDYTTDGTNYRLTQVAHDPQERVTRIRMEDGHGSVYIFAQIVPESCDADLDDLDYSDTSLAPFNFGTQKAGLYLTEIQRGPWRSGPDGGEPENRITFAYRGTADGNGWGDTSCGSVGSEPWLLASITAEAAVDRSVTFSYTPLGGVSVLDSITVPAFNPTLGSTSPSPYTAVIDWSVSSAQFVQTNANHPDITFNGPRLDRVTLPEGPSFVFEQLADGFLGSVTLPSGALVEYWEALDYPVGVAGWDQFAGESGEGYPRHCGVLVPVRPDEIPGSPFPDDRRVKTKGVQQRTITYADASSPSGTRQETTWFRQSLSCVGNDAFTTTTQWPYNFDPFLRDGSRLRKDYLFTVVVHQAGNGSALVASAAEIHRFHPLTREEFSVDYVEGPEAWSLLPLDWPADEALPTLDVRVLRHVEIEKAVLPTSILPTVRDDKDLEYYQDRYTFDMQTRVFTDTASTPASQDVMSCYPMVTPGATATVTTLPDITCTEVRTTTERSSAGVDKYLNRLLTTVESVNNIPSSLNVSRSIANHYVYAAGGDNAEGEYVWTLGLKTGETVTEGGQSTETGYFWENISTVDPDVQRYYVLDQQTLNPDSTMYRAENTLLNAFCTNATASCVRHDLTYDTLGNLTMDTVSGGAGSGFEALDASNNKGTFTTYSHGRAVKKEQLGGGDHMLLWEREVDPSTGLARWHVDGSGMGFAYLYDDAGRFTDIAPIDASDSGSRTWGFALQTTMVDGVATTVKGSHVEYMLPSEGKLLRHKIFDTSWDNSAIGSQLAPGDCDPETDTPRSIFRFDGLGRLTQETERYPGGTRSRFHMTYLHADPAVEPCDEPHGWDILNKARVNLDSEWFDDGELPDSGDGELPLNDGFPGCPTSLGSGWTAWTETQLDGLGRPAWVHAPDGTDLTRTYRGDAITVTTRQVADDISSGGAAVFNSFVTTATSDGFGRLRRLEEEVSKLPAASYLTTYDYDERDQLTSVKLWNTALTGYQPRAFEYWGAGFVKTTTEPERTLDLQGYDAAGNLTKELTAGTGVTVNHEYDGFGRLLRSKEGSTTFVEQSWGNPHGGGGVAIGYPSYNRVVSSTRHNRFGASDVPVTHRWAYGGPGGRPSHRKTLIGGIGSGGESFDLDYGHDTWGNQSELTFPYYAGCRYSSWERQETSYDGEWALDARLVTHDGTEQFVGDLGYHPSGRVARLDYGDGFSWWQETADPDKMARPARIDLFVDGVLEPAGTSGDFGFDSAGNVYKIGGKRYSYDGLSRLEKYSVWQDGTRALSFKEGYAPDRWGNMTRVDRPNAQGAPAPHLTFTLEDVNPVDLVPDSNRIATLNASAKAPVSLSWGGRGNLTHQGAVGDLREKTYEWTTDDRLKQSTDDATGTVWRYAYDAGGERVMRWMTLNGEPSGLNATIFLRDEGGQVVSEWDYATGGASFNVSRDYVSAGGRTIAQVDYGAPGGSVDYFSSDHLGSTRVVFNDAGQVLDSMDYMPFGELDGGGTPGATHLFTGQERDLGTTSSELDQFHQRYYSRDLLRFTSVDPVKGNTASSQSHNRYSFVLNNPLRFVDPNGEDAWDVVNGFANGLGSSGLGNAGRVGPMNGDFAIGQRAGDAAAVVAGAFEILLGSTGEGAGLVTAPEGGVVALAPSAALVAHGSLTLAAGFANLLAQNGNPAESGGGSDVSRGDLKRVNDKQLERKGVDAHQVKRDELGRNADVSKWDIATDNKGNAYLISKDNKQVRDLGGTLDDLAQAAE